MKNHTFKNTNEYKNGEMTELSVGGMHNIISNKLHNVNCLIQLLLILSF